MNEVKKCPKCEGEMIEGEDLMPFSLHWVRDVKLRKKGDHIGDEIIPFCCTDYGYIELFRKMEEKKEQAMNQVEECPRYGNVSARSLFCH